jgi:hypothetical protein
MSRCGIPQRFSLRLRAVQADFSETLVGVAELAVALAGFTGVVVAFGSRGDDSWHPGDRLRLSSLRRSSGM